MIENKKEGFKYTAVGWIPEDWEVKHFGDVLTNISNGINYNIEDKEGLPVTRIETISDGVINFGVVIVKGSNFNIF